MHYIYIYYDVLPHHELRTDRRSDDTAFRAGTFSWQDPVHSWTAGPGEVMTDLLSSYGTFVSFLAGLVWAEI